MGILISACPNIQCSCMYMVKANDGLADNMSSNATRESAAASLLGQTTSFIAGLAEKVSTTHLIQHQYLYDNGLAATGTAPQVVVQ